MVPAITASPSPGGAPAGTPPPRPAAGGGLRIAQGNPAPSSPPPPRPAHAPGGVPASSRPQDKSWLTTFILAWFLGGLGIDRFYTGRIGLGIGKLLTGAGCGLWGLIDVILLFLKKYQDAEGNRLQPAQRNHQVIALSVVAATLLLNVVVAAVIVKTIQSEVSGFASQAQSINCMNNLKQVGLAFRLWSGDNDDRYPFNVPGAEGGTLEFCQRTPDGFDANAFRHFLVMSNELSTPKILTCPGDPSRKPAQDWGDLTSANVTYQVRSGPEISENHPDEVLAQCPIDGNTLYCDGRVERRRK